eukprot:7001764-Lingulodinium_polyedra.AAC.1
MVVATNPAGEEVVAPNARASLPRSANGRKNGRRQQQNQIVHTLVRLHGAIQRREVRELRVQIADH